MQRLQAYRFELRPSGFQDRQMRRFAGTCRSVFNRALSIQRERHAEGLNTEAASRRASPGSGAAGIPVVQGGEDVKAFVPNS